VKSGNGHAAEANWDLLRPLVIFERSRQIPAAKMKRLVDDWSSQLLSSSATPRPILQHESRRDQRTLEKNDMNTVKAPVGQIRTEVRGHVMKIIIDNPAKKNSFSPQMLYQMSDALTLLDKTDEYWVGVVCAEGGDFTAGLDMPKFFGPKAENWDLREGTIDVFALANRCRKPIVTAVQGIVYTIGIEMMLAGDIVIARR